MRRQFVASYDAKHALVPTGDATTLIIGNDDFPFAFPLVKTADRWRFDTQAGKEELRARRIGENELDAIKVLQAIVDAERDYASADRNGNGVPEYAMKFTSSPGKHDGLFWPTKEGEPPSPLGLLVAKATSEGYQKNTKGPTPYRGYYYRLLKGQGANAPMGALDYVVRGRAIGGFAVVAYPAKYGSSGIMRRREDRGIANRKRERTSTREVYHFIALGFSRCQGLRDVRASSSAARHKQKRRARLHPPSIVAWKTRQCLITALLSSSAPAAGGTEAAVLSVSSTIGVG